MSATMVYLPAGALKGRGGTIAVVGTGLDIVYPARNRPLAHELAERVEFLGEQLSGRDHGK